MCMNLLQNVYESTRRTYEPTQGVYEYTHEPFWVDYSQVW